MKKTGLFYRILSLLLAVLLIVTPASATETGTDAAVTDPTEESVVSDSSVPSKESNVESDGPVDLSVLQGCRTIEGKVGMSDPLLELAPVFAAFLYDATNDIVVYSVNPDERYAPASLVKIMSGLLIAQHGNMKDEVTVSQEVLDTLSSEGGIMGLQVGEVFTMQELMYLMMVVASNEAAAVAADHVFGSQEALIEEMNAYAQRLGCTNTNFTNVHGLHDDNQYTTARDMVKIVLEAEKNDVFMDAFSTSSYSLPETNKSDPRDLLSNNYLLFRWDYKDKRVTGGRTGFVQGGERNLIVTAMKDDIEMVAVVFGSLYRPEENALPGALYDLYLEVKTLLDLGYSNQHAVQILFENQVLRQFEVENGDSYVSVGIKDAVNASLLKGVSEDSLHYLYSQENMPIKAPVKAGDVLSNVQVWYKDVCLAQADLYALHDVDEKYVVATEDVAEERETSAFTLLTVVAVIVGLLVLLLFGRRLIFRLIHRRQARRNRRNQRRSR